jgi:PKD repeat protein
MKKEKNILRKAMRIILCFSIVLFTQSCQKQFEFELPEANSIADNEFPVANFAYASALEDFKTIKFTNLSTEAINYEWDFGDGNVSTEKDPVFTFEEGEGTYPVTLTASDGNGVTGSTTIEVLVVEGPFQPIILEPGFEDNTLPDGSGDGRDSWRKSELGGVIQITGSPVTFGDQGAKLPEDQTRIGYQEIMVEPQTNYDLRFWYTMVNNPTDPWLTVAVIGVTQFGPIETKEDATEGTIGSVTVNDISEPDVYLEQLLAFNSGDNNTIAIYFFNGPVECRLDNFTIDIGAEGEVPPSTGFDVEQSESNYLEYSFTNTSTNATSYEWDFGDGNMSTEESPTHVYATPDEYTITLTAINDAGLSTTLSKTIKILAPVTADFTFEAHPDDYRTILFTDASEGAEMLLWEFGDGYQFTGMNPEHTYMDDGIYTVTLTAYSITGNMDVKELDVTISQSFIASIREAGFEDDDPSAAACGDGFDGRDCWKNGALGGVIQITSSPVKSGSQAAKLPSDGTRIGYQLVDVEPNRQYTVTFWYTMKTDPAGTLTVSILDGRTLNDISEVDGATINSITVNDQNDADTYIEESIVFESGDNSQIAVFFTNEGVECRVDDFSIDVSEVFMPTILEPGFEDNSLPDGTGDGRDSWKNDALGGTIQITSSPVNSGSQAAKLPSDGTRIGYQLIEVEANTDYRVSFFYTMKTDPAGSLTVSILDGSTLTDPSEVPAATITSITVNDQTDADAYIMENIVFNSGGNNMIAIFFTNDSVESRIDDFSITKM